MKKLFLMIVSILLLTGCGEKKPLEVLDNTINTMNEVTNLELESKVNVKVNSEGVAVDIKLPFNVLVDENDDETKFKINVGANPLVGELQVYGKLNKENFVLYFPSSVLELVLGETEGEEKWLSISGNLNETLNEKIADETQTEIKKIDYKKIILEENFVLVDKEENIGHYQLIVDADLLESLFTELGEDFEKTEEVSETKIDFYIDLETNQFTKIYMDMKNMIVGFMEDAIEEFDPNMFEELSFEMNFKNYNSTIVTIPENVTNEAMDYEEYLKTIISEK